MTTAKHMMALYIQIPVFCITDWSLVQICNYTLPFFEAVHNMTYKIIVFFYFFFFPFFYNYWLHLTEVVLVILCSHLFILFLLHWLPKR